jgi:hypothetical protein
MEIDDVFVIQIPDGGMVLSFLRKILGIRFWVSHYLEHKFSLLFDFLNFCDSVCKIYFLDYLLVKSVNHNCQVFVRSHQL